jgi:acid stress-induced BolA-like protein IbaG/YrbA
VHPDQVEALIKSEIPDSQVKALSSDGSHFEVTVISASFEGKRRVQQHQMVYAAVKQAVNSEAIHALQLNTMTPAEASQTVV